MCADAAASKPHDTTMALQRQNASALLTFLKKSFRWEGDGGRGGEKTIDFQGFTYDRTYNAGVGGSLSVIENFTDDVSKIAIQQINRKIYGYKQQDIIKKLFNLLTFREHSSGLEGLALDEDEAEDDVDIDEDDVWADSVV